MTYHYRHKINNKAKQIQFVIFDKIGLNGLKKKF